MKDIITKNSYELAKELMVTHKRILTVIRQVEADLNEYDHFEYDHSISTFDTHFKFNPHYTKKNKCVTRYDIDLAGYYYVCNKLRSPMALAKQMTLMENLLSCK